MGDRLTEEAVIRAALDRMSPEDCKRLWMDTFVDWGDSRAFKARILAHLLQRIEEDK